MEEFSLGVSSVSFLYLLFLDGYMPLNAKDRFIWIAVVVFFLLLWYINRLYRNKKSIPLWLVVSSNTIAAVAVFVLIVVQILIFSAMGKKQIRNADYLIVVGDRSNEIGTPSVNTGNVLNTVLQYLRNNPDTYVILTGNQAEDQVHNIVYVMAKYLMNEGVQREYLLTEMQASSLMENIVYSNEIVRWQVANNRKDFEGSLAINAGPVYIAEEEKPIRIGLAVCDCFAYRAKELAKKAGLRHFDIYPVKSDFVLYPHLFLREVIYIFKDKFIGQI